MGKKKKYEIIAEIQETINQIESLEETTLPKLLRELKKFKLSRHDLEDLSDMEIFYVEKENTKFLIYEHKKSSFVYSKK